MNRILLLILFISGIVSVSAQHFNGESKLLDDFMSSKVLYYEMTNNPRVDSVVEKFIQNEWKNKDLEIDTWINIQYDQDNPKYMLRFSKSVFGVPESWMDFGKGMFIQKVIKDSQKEKKQSSLMGLMGKIDAIAYLPFHDVEGEFKGVLIENCLIAIKHGIEHKFEYLHGKGAMQKNQIHRKNISLLSTGKTLLFREDQIKENVTNEVIAKVLEMDFKIVKHEEWLDCIENRKQNYLYLNFSPQYQIGKNYEKQAKYNKNICCGDCSFNAKVFLVDCETGHILLSNNVYNESGKVLMPKFSSAGIKKINKILTK